MKVTREWLQEIRDEKGWTKGQIDVLNHWAKKRDWVGIEISDQVAHFLMCCKGFRNGRYEHEQPKPTPLGLNQG